MLLAHPHPLDLNNRVISATYGVVTRRELLERCGQGNRRHHGHRLPLLWLLSDVDGVRGEGFETGTEAGKQTILRVLVVSVLHRDVFPKSVRTAVYSERAVHYH